jgi:hypothetical protein
MDAGADITLFLFLFVSCCSHVGSVWFKGTMERPWACQEILTKNWAV